MQKVVIISHQSFKKNDIVQTKESLQEKPHYIMSHLCHISLMCYYSLWLILFNQKCKQRRCRLPPCCRAATAKGNCCGSLLPIKRCGHLFFCSVILKIHSSLQMEGETSPIFERRATVSLKEKVNSLENKFLGMRQSIVEDIKKDLREELREGTQNIEEYDSEALLKEEKMISKMKAEIKQEVMDDIKTEMSQSLKGLFEQNIRMFDDLQTNLYDNIKIELLDSIKEKMEGNIEKTLLNKIRVVMSRDKVSTGTQVEPSDLCLLGNPDMEDQEEQSVSLLNNV